jgi:hypothetical protein
LGLAILGEGGLKAFFSHAPLIALAIGLLALSGTALFAGGDLSSGSLSASGGAKMADAAIPAGGVGWASEWRPQLFGGLAEKLAALRKSAPVEAGRRDLSGNGAIGSWRRP